MRTRHCDKNSLLEDEDSDSNDEDDLVSVASTG